MPIAVLTVTVIERCMTGFLLDGNERPLQRAILGHGPMQQNRPTTLARARTSSGI